MTNYYVLTLDTKSPNGLLGNLHVARENDLNPATLWQGVRYSGPMPLHAASWPQAQQPDLSWNIDMIPVVTAQALAAFTLLAKDHFQAIPLGIEGRKSDCSVVNVTTLRDCVDPSRNLPMPRWQECDAGSLQRYPAVVDIARAADTPLLRASRWLSPIFVSSSMKDGLETSGLSGLAFIETL